ncbi:hypothetical protein DMC30DRAFT_366299 [Rhodotorula diobovata]|uniref:MYND-type domain-containing protein n=1 Tax=Rhodotorula diobovata TaxID=5288 RepID=A0A5C5FVA0_9BASI|nr:hypothetical protein DMC30DRAFT_366299 [Rhodotorula diobovata]
MASSESGGCLVCGIDTKQRCSNCDQAGINLWFCSREHQKFVYFAHKLLCGPGKANPLTWPLLSDIEADQAIADKTVPFASLAHQSMESLFDEMVPSLRGQLDDLIRGPLSNGGPSPMSPDILQALLVTVRMLAYHRLAASGRVLNMRREDVLAHVAALCPAYGFEPLLQPSSTPQDVAAAILHQLVVYAALLARTNCCAADGSGSELELLEYMSGALTRMRDRAQAEPSLSSSTVRPLENALRVIRNGLEALEARP